MTNTNLESSISVVSLSSEQSIRSLSIDMSSNISQVEMDRCNENTTTTTVNTTFDVQPSGTTGNIVNSYRRRVLRNGCIIQNRRKQLLRVCYIMIIDNRRSAKLCIFFSQTLVPFYYRGRNFNQQVFQINRVSVQVICPLKIRL
jgi:hypothetical protein